MRYEDTEKTWSARYSGWCPLCDKPICKGSVVGWTAYPRQVAHSSCLPWTR